MEIDVYLTPASAPCRSVLMTAKHLDIAVNEKKVDIILTKEQLKPEFLKMNPQHCVPTICDNGFYLWESRAIQTYLVNKYAPDSSLYPKDPQKRAIVDRMLYFDIGTLYQAEIDYMFPCLFHKQSPDPEKLKVFKNAVKLLDQFLEQSDYVAGDKLTVADHSVLSSLTFIEVPCDCNLGEFPNVSAWLAKLKSELPYYKEINEVPLLAFKEILREHKNPLIKDFSPNKF